MSRRASRDAAVDWIKVIAAQCIVLHHFAWYGPAWGLPQGAAGPVYDTLAQYGRLAVQAFLVAGGFLAARASSPSFWPSVADRHRRLVLPMVCALALVVPVAAWVRPWLPAGVAPVEPTWSGLAAHLALAQDVLGVPAMSTGLWYVAIDFQLSVLLLAITVLLPGRGLRTAVVLGLGAASLLVFNRSPGWDAYAPYYFGSYALGITARGWREPGGWRWPFVAMLAFAMTGLAIEWRARVAVSVVVATLLVAWPAARATPRPLLTRLSTSSFSLFLVHFPVFLLIDGVFARWLPRADGTWIARLSAAWVVSMGAAEVFERLLGRLLAGRPRGAGGRVSAVAPGAARAALPAPGSRPGSRA